MDNRPGPNHPIVRWRSKGLDAAILGELQSLRFADPKGAERFRESMLDAFDDLDGQRQRQQATLMRRRAELAGVQERLLNAYLAGTFDAGAFQKGSADLKTQQTRCRDSLERYGEIDASNGDTAVDLFNWSQRATEQWRVSSNTEQREILEA